MKKTHVIAAGVLGLVVIGSTAACATDADVVSQNISKAAEQFEINRRIVFINGITNDYMLTIEGFCSVEVEDRKLAVTCKTGPNEYKKHFLGQSDNVTWISEQIESAGVSPDHYRVIFKPESLVPDVDRP